MGIGLYLNNLYALYQRRYTYKHSDKTPLNYGNPGQNPLKVS